MNIIYKATCVLILLTFSLNLSAIVYNSVPKDMNELVKTSDLVVVGTIGEVVDKRLFYGYQENADQLAQKEQETPFTLGLPLVDYAIHVQEVIMDDKEFPLAGTNAHSIIFRTFEDHDEVSSASAVKDRRGQMMFFLTRNPDNETYGIVSIMHRIKLGNGNNEVSYSLNHENFRVPFAPEIRGKEFKTEVKKHVK